jgi:hypothetical protein
MQASPEPEKRQYEHDHDDQSDQIDQASHDFLPGFTCLLTPNNRVSVNVPVAGRPALSVILDTVDADLPVNGTLVS